MKISLPLVALSLILLSSCTKSEKDQMEENCNLIQNVKITGAKEQYFEGETVELGINEQPAIALYQWFRPNSNDLSGTTTLTIDYCDKSDQGWYYLAVSYEECTTKVDSVYISIKHNPADPPCTVADNTIDFSSIPEINATSVTWGLDATYNKKKLGAHQQSGYPDFNIYFNGYWNDKEPEDGEYNLGSQPTLSDFNPYAVYISSLYSGILFSGNSGSVYISHENGKIKATFCSVGLSGSNGSNSFSTTATGSIKAP